MTTEYDLWEALLAAKKSGQDPPAIDHNYPASGFYRSRRKGQPYVPVAIWRHGEELFCHVSGQEISNEETIKSWPWYAANPISWKEYKFYQDHGRWEDADETVDQLAKIGDNNPPDEFVLLHEQIEIAAKGISEYVEISNDIESAKAQGLRSRLLELSGAAEKKREAEKKPFLEGGKAVDKKWKPLVDAASTAADSIRSSMRKWETAKAAKIREEQAKALEARRAVEEAAKAAGKAPPPPPDSIAQAAPQSIKGAYGRAASVKPVKVFKKITDLDAALKFFKETPEIKEAIITVAKSYCKHYPETELPGIETAMEMDVR